MRTLVYITLTTLDGFELWLEHRELKSICRIAEGETEVAGWLVSESPEEIVKKVNEAWEAAEGGAR
ncbi:hypothetical protein TURBIDO_38 [Mycobacterium phage Turbido]|uniref:Uncharacterized protein n=7 Tax=Turbidovirus TaxID=2948936 RepID=A0A143FPE1_9CAUD|nr:hypothetical protein TURBIDO_38 [Mycobacterium phage Turbido]YP_009303974.1 hypothetical protein SEA_EVILGENIUS_40 [Mycobacterium phage EvilGenius]AMW64296.1 hypothetical protein SEA_CHIPMUNK_40 [Mycobacterium phage ChipMunk]AOT27778.1 hypothetical protein SEA_JERM_39 [Mycobacterium phage Jerm]AWH13556.1 hypothetical protein SEA_ABBYPAIGE_39 [Mycobacterium phage AbbyPaige]AYD86587.1 hypothetical protein SEA_LILTURB_38 [Mycobacterium phage LilTurb]QBI96541.1 hypothetical protein SEA_WHABIGA